MGRARLGQAGEGRLEGSVGHTGTSGEPREGRERNSPVGSPGGRGQEGAPGPLLSHTVTFS